MRSAIYWTALFMLAAPTVSVAGSKNSGPQSSEDKIVCKRAAETGSFARSKKTCMTAREWRQMAEGSKDRGREMQSLISTESGQ